MIVVERVIKEKSRVRRLEAIVDGGLWHEEEVRSLELSKPVKKGGDDVASHHAARDTGSSLFEHRNSCSSPTAM